MNDGTDVPETEACDLIVCDMATSNNYVMRHVLDLEYEKENPPPEPSDNTKILQPTYDKLLSDK